MAMPAGNMLWSDIPARAKVIEHRNYFEVIDGKKRYVANWSSQDAREAQAWLRQRASKGSRSHATKRTSAHGMPIDTTETLDQKFRSRERHSLTLLEKARQARGAAARWMKRSNTYARGGQHQEADDAQTEAIALGRMADSLTDEAASLKSSSRHATKRKSPTQLDREIAEHLRGRGSYANSPSAWQEGYDFAKESSRHETRAEQREVLRRVAPGASEYDRGFMAAYQDLLGIAREKRSHATRKGSGNVGYEVSRTTLGETRSVVFTSRGAAEKFQAANEGSQLREVKLDSSGRIAKPSHTTKKSADKAIDTVHTLKMSDGRVITTTWHDTRAEANKRIKNTAGRDPSHDRVLADRVLGNFKAVTWSY